MIIQAFLRWVETARTSDRIRAAAALARAYCASGMNTIDRHAAEMAMTFLLDDPSPKVRLALAEVLGGQATAPRQIVLSLAEDQPEIAFAVVMRSPCLSDADLVDLAARGTPELRAFIALRAPLSRSVAAAIAEVGDEPEVLILLENTAAALSRRTLKRLADRLGASPAVRHALLERDDLPADARQVLVEEVGAALTGAAFLRAAIGDGRLKRVAREACEQAAIDMAGLAEIGDLPDLVEELRVTSRLTPGLLLQALCLGRIDFFAAALVDLTAIGEKRVRAILSDGRMHAVRALFEASGLGRDVSTLFADAILIWRRESHIGPHAPAASIASVLVHRLRETAGPDNLPHGLSEAVEKLAVAEQRRTARDYALLAARQAA